jgi:hypothetical protein
VDLCRGMEPTVITTNVVPVSARESAEIPRWFYAVEVTARGPSMTAICGAPISVGYVDVNVPWEPRHALSCRECMLMLHTAVEPD